MRKKPGRAIHSMPPSAAARNISTSRNGSGPVLVMATKVQKIEPKIICPSRPMFQKRTRKAIAAASPTMSSGAACTRTALSAWGFEKIETTNSV